MFDRLVQENSTGNRAINFPQVLVVIAGTAVFLAILFPVLAQARAKQSLNPELSQIKEVGTAVLLYVNDWDDKYGFSLESDWKATWASGTFPYIRNGDPWVSPYDTVQGPNPAYPFLSPSGGRTISIVSNSFYHAPGDPDSTSCSCAKPCVNAGLFTAIAAPGSCGNEGGQGWNGGNSWLAPMNKDINRVTHPADTIALAFRYNTDAINAGGYGNLTQNFGVGLFCVNCSGHWDWADPVELPDGRLPAVNGTTTLYPNGRNGAVSYLHSRGANFAFVDGHVASLDPGSTDPDPVNLPASNKWDADR